SVSPAALSPKGMADGSGVVPAVPAFTTGTAPIPVFDSSIESFAMNTMVSLYDGLTGARTWKARTERNRPLFRYYEDRSGSFLMAAINSVVEWRGRYGIKRTLPPYSWTTFASGKRPTSGWSLFAF